MPDNFAQSVKTVSLPPATELWQIPGILAAVVIFSMAAYVARNPIETPSGRDSDFEALTMAYENGNTLSSASSAEKFLSRYPSTSREALARFIFADSRWDIIRSNPAATAGDLSICLDSYKRALFLGLPPAYEAAARRAKGDILMRMDLTSDALQAYTDLAFNFPKERSVLLALSDAYTRTKPPSVEKAARLINDYLASPQVSPLDLQLGYLAKARLAMVTGDLDSAMAAARTVIEAEPSGDVAAQAALLLAQALSAKGDFDAALGALDGVSIADAGRFEAELLLAKAYALSKKGDIKEAAGVLDETIFRFPSTPQCLTAKYRLALILFESGSLDAAKDALVSLLDDMAAQEAFRTLWFDVDDLARLWFAVGRRILEVKNYPAVHDFHSAALALMSQGHFLFFDATLYLREAEQEQASLPGLSLQKAAAATARIQKAYLEAGGLFAKVLDTASGDLYREALFNAGHSYFLAGDFSLANRYFLRFTRSDYRDRRVPQALYESAAALAQMGNFSTAVDLCDQNLRDHPSNIYAYRSLLLQGDLYRSMGADNLPYAADVYSTILTDRRFLTTSAEWKSAIFSLGETLYRLERCNDAVLKLEEALQRFPSDPRAADAKYYMALASRQAGLQSPPSRRAFLEKAADVFAEIAATDKDPSRSSDAAFLEADCRYDLADYERALVLYDRAAEAHVDTPEATRALFQIANCYHRLGRAQIAEATYKRALFNLNRQALPVEPGAQFYRSLAEWRSGDPGNE